MKQFGSFERVSEGIERAQRHWATRHRGHGAAPLPGTAFTIALSREAGTPGTSVARAVGERLGWPVYDQELVQRIAQEMGLRASLLESVDERHASWLRECVEAFASGPTVTEGSYVRHLVEALLSLGTHGECIIVGRGAAHVLPAATTLRVRLVGTREDCIANTMHRRGLSHAEAAQWVETTGRERRRFIKDHFQKDPADPTHYDLILNASRYSTAECADLIVVGLHSLQAHTPA